jgi:hypothetical protein
MGKARKEIGKKFRKLGKIVREIRGRVWRDFLISGRRRGFRDDGDGEADRPAGTAACAGFPARWPTAALGRRAWVLARVWCRQDSRYARRGEREGQ